MNQQQLMHAILLWLEEKLANTNMSAHVTSSGKAGDTCGFEVSYKFGKSAATYSEFRLMFNVTTYVVCTVTGFTWHARYVDADMLDRLVEAIIRYGKWLEDEYIPSTRIPIVTTIELYPRMEQRHG